MSFSCSLCKNRGYLPIVPKQWWGPYWKRNSTLCYSKSDTLLAASYEDFLELYYWWSIECFGCESRCDQTFDSEGSAFQLSRQFGCLSVLSGPSRAGWGVSAPAPTHIGHCQSERPKSTLPCGLSSQDERRPRQCICIWLNVFVFRIWLKH